MTAAHTRAPDSSRANTVAQVLPLVATYGVYLVATPIVISSLGITSFGIWAVTGAIAQYAALFDFGVSRAVTRFVSLYHNQGRVQSERRAVGAAVAWVSVIGLVLCGCAFLAAPVLAMHFALDVAAAQIILCCSVTIAIVGILSRVVAAAAFGRGRMVAMNYVLAVSSALWQVGGLVYLSWGTSLEGFAIASAVGSLVGLLLTIIGFGVTERRNPFSWPTVSDTRTLFSFGVRAQAVSVADLLVFQFGKIALGLFVGPSAAAAYEIASRIASGARSFGVLAGTALTPKLTAMYATGGIPAVVANYYRYARQMTTVSLLPLVMAASGAFPFLATWLSDYPSGTGLLCISLCLAYILNVSTSMSTVAAYAIGSPGAVAKSAIATTVVYLALVISLIGFYGVLGCAIAILLALGLGSALGPYFVSIAMRERFISYIRAVVGPVFLAFSVVIATISVELVLGNYWSLPSWLVLVCAVSAASIAFLLGARWRGYLPSVRWRSTMRSLAMIRG